MTKKIEKVLAATVDKVKNLSLQRFVSTTSEGIVPMGDLARPLLMENSAIRPTRQDALDSLAMELETRKGAIKEPTANIGTQNSATSQSETRSVQRRAVLSST